MSIPTAVQLKEDRVKLATESLAKAIQGMTLTFVMQDNVYVAKPLGGVASEAPDQPFSFDIKVEGEKGRPQQNITLTIKSETYSADEITEALQRLEIPDNLTNQKIEHNTISWKGVSYGFLREGSVKSERQTRISCSIRKPKPTAVVQKPNAAPLGRGPATQHDLHVGEIQVAVSAERKPFASYILAQISEILQTNEVPLSSEPGQPLSEEQRELIAAFLPGRIDDSIKFLVIKRDGTPLAKLVEEEFSKLPLVKADRESLEKTVTGLITPDKSIQYVLSEEAARSHASLIAERKRLAEVGVDSRLETTLTIANGKPTVNYELRIINL